MNGIKANEMMIDITPISASAIFSEYKTDGHSPLLVLGSDFEKYVVKNDKGRIPPYAILNEIIASLFLKQWDIETPEPKLLELPLELLENQKYSQNHKPIYYEYPTFASKHIEPARDLNDLTFTFARKSYNEIINPHDIFKITLFDTWVENDDRKPTNYNLLLKDEGKKYKILPIDHAFIFSTLAYKDLHKNTFCPIENEHLLVSDFGRLIKKYTKIENAFISEMKQYFYLCVKKSTECLVNYKDELIKLYSIDEVELSSLINFLKDSERNSQVFDEFIQRLKQ